MEVIAEDLLRNLQHCLLHASQEAQSQGSKRARQSMRELERVHGPHVTRFGRRLHELVAGSHAWSLYEKSRARGRLPRIHELSQCEPLLQVMRESGELAERERLLTERDLALVALWREPTLTDAERWLAGDALQDRYAASVKQVTAAYRPFYRDLRRATADTRPLGGPQARSLPLLLPPIMALLFAACHSHQDPADAPSQHERVACHVRDTIQFLPTGLEDAAALDAMAWDIAALAVSAFFVRTNGSDPDAAFPFLLEDYPIWRRLDSRKRTPDLRRRIDERLDILCSERLRLDSTLDLWQTDPATGLRRRWAVVTAGPFLVKRGRFFRTPPTAGDTGQDAADGYLLSLGDWARAPVAQRAFRGVALRRLASYDAGRQQWERRIGWYLVFQMTNQAPKMTFQDVTRDGRTRTLVTPQHPLKMRTVLQGSRVEWETLARTNPGKVIRQWTDALETLHRDGVIGPSDCLDGAADGSDLPLRGRLAAMLDRRYQFTPGRDLLPHLRAKRGGRGGNSCYTKRSK